MTNRHPTLTVAQAEVLAGLLLVVLEICADAAPVQVRLILSERQAQNCLLFAPGGALRIRALCARVGARYGGPPILTMPDPPPPRRRIRRWVLPQPLRNFPLLT